MNQLHYKDYVGSVFFSEEDGVFHGKVMGISDSVSFEGESVKSLTDDFHNAVEEYLEFCAANGKQPEKSTFSINVSPEIYNKATVYASRSGLPLNMFVERIIEMNLTAN